MEHFNFKDKVVIITGAGSGIGEATAKKFATYGATLALIDFNAQTLATVSSYCDNIASKLGNPKTFTFVGDLTNDAVRKQFVEEVEKTFSKIDILVNNAGMQTPCSIFDSSMEAADKQFNILYRVHYDMCRLTAKYLVKTKGIIVNIASICGQMTACKNPAYNAAKAAMISLTKSLADELGEFGVRVNSISPGPIFTNLIGFKGPGEHPLVPFGKLACNLGRSGNPEEIANVVCFLASNFSSYMTGSDVVVDGGMMSKCQLPI